MLRKILSYRRYMQSQCMNCNCDVNFTACVSLQLQHYSFYDLIVTKARGKSGPLFHFDVHDDIRYGVSSAVYVCMCV